MRGRFWGLLAVPGLGWLVVFFAVAFYAIVAVALGYVDTLYVPQPQWNPLDWNVGYLWIALQDVAPGGRTWDDIVRTVIYITAAVSLSLVIGFPVAWYAARHAGRFKGPLLVALVLPFWISYLMRMFAWTNLLDSSGYATRLLHSLSIDSALMSVGLLDEGGWLGGQHITVVMALVYGYLPYLILPLFAALDRIDQRQIEAARDLGAGPFSAFWRVVVPLSRTGTLAGVVLIALPMFGDYFTSDLMSGTARTTMVGNVINSGLQSGPEKPVAAALTIVLSVSLLALMAYYLRALRREERRAVQG